MELNRMLSVHVESPFPICGRDLHEQLEIDTSYSKWFSRMCEYGFEEGKDF